MRSQKELVQNLKNEVKKIGADSLEIIKKCQHPDVFEPELNDLLDKSIRINKRCHAVYDKLRCLESQL